MISILDVFFPVIQTFKPNTNLVTIEPVKNDHEIC